MKIGIITFHTALNYGAVLQAYGLQQTIKKINNACEIIDYDCVKFKRDYAVIKFSIHIKKTIRSMGAARITLQLKKKYSEFVKRYLICSKKRYSNIDIQECSGKYDLFITGSDQVWDPYCAAFDPNYFLTFVEENYKKASYAASFDKMVIPEPLEEEFVKRISDFTYISCREEAGAELVRKLTGKKALVHADPSFLLNADEWKKISTKPSIQEPYLFIYPVGQSDEMLDFAKALARKKGLKVVYLVYNKPWRDPEVTFVTGAGPDEFLGYVYYAQYVVTNAFHGTAFSLIFHKPFYSFCGVDGKGNTRIRTILNKCELTDRIIHPGTLNSQSDSIEWSALDEWVCNEQRKTNEYLNTIIGRKK